MSRTTVFTVSLLALIWLVLKENFSVPETATGIAIGAVCIFICFKLLPFAKIKKIKVLRLLVYPFYIIFKVYMAGISTIKLILTDADADIVEVKTKISNGFLRALLANSITLIPGSISLELEDDVITVLRLKKKNNENKTENAGEALKGKLEKILLKTER